MFIDVIITLLLLWAIYDGWTTGALKQLISTAGFLVGLFAAVLLYEWLGKYLGMTGSHTNMVLNVMAFIILWVIVPIVLGLVATIITKTADALHLGVPNRLLGAAISFVKYAVLLSCVFNVMESLSIITSDKTAQSSLYSPVTKIVGFLSGNKSDSTETSSTKAGDTIWVKTDAPRKATHR